jgi:phospholipid transport system transporter-binding protein
MSEVQLQALGDGRFALQGPVVFSTAGDLLKTGNRLFAGNTDVHLDLSAVTRVDSAALALIIEWLRQAEHTGHKLHFTGMPEKLRSIAQLTGTDAILEPLAERTEPPGNTNQKV